MQVSTLRLRSLAAALALASASSAWAEDPNPYYIGVSQAFTHDSNVFRAPPGTAKGDTYSSTGLLAGVDQPFGRQRFYANGSVRYNKFSDQGQLDNTSYGLNTGLDLSTINHISGALNYTVNQNLYNYGGANTVSLVEKNVERSQQFSGRASWGLVGLWSLDANGSHRSLRYSATGYSFANLDQDTGSIGLTYRPSGLISMGVAYRATHGDYPALDRSFKRDDIDLTSTWIPTGQSTVSGRLSYGKQKYSDAPTRNSVTSGSLAWDYRPTGKLSFNLWASRDTGAESSFFNFPTTAGGSQTAVGDNSQRTTTLALGAGYAATGKINVNANARYARRELNNSLSFTGAGSNTATGTDINRIYSIGATYAALRSLLFACTLSRDTRSASGDLSFPYKANTVGCSAQFTLQ